MFTPDVDLAALTSHVSYMFHVVVGLDPLGGFSSVQGLSYEVGVLEYNELGRNHSPVLLPYSEPGKTGVLTLQWGTVVRSMLFNWMHDVEVGTNFRRDIIIFQLSQQRLPLRMYKLKGAWPKSWQASEMTTERAEWSTETLEIVYERMTMKNLSAVAMAGGLIGSPLNAAIDKIRPAAFRPRPNPKVRHTSSMGGSTKLKGQRVTYEGGKIKKVQDHALGTATRASRPADKVESVPPPEKQLRETHGVASDSVHKAKEDEGSTNTENTEEQT